MANSKKLILDTNFVQYLASEKFTTDAVGLLEKLDAAKYSIAISEYSHFEVYRGANLKKIKVTKPVVDSFGSYNVGLDEFKIAAALYSCCKNNSNTARFASGIEDGDYIIGATAFSYGAYVLTGNYNDYPRPFFKEADSFTLTYANKKRGTTNSITIYLLKPNFKAFNAEIAACYPDF